jgi:N6-L-threonylcarbamoyladenine synthase
MEIHPFILGIEYSCDDTSAAVIQNYSVISNIRWSQTIHTYYGGVVPEIASRVHQRDIVPLVRQVIKSANIQLDQINAISFTLGPGLINSLLVGTNFSKFLALSLNIPIIGVHHIQAHILSHFILIRKKYNPKFPFICLTISGGHTLLVLVEDCFKMTLLEKTIDDAAGEVFDKISKILGLGYPGGILIDHYAYFGNPNKFYFYIPNGTNFSFSGLKTQIYYFIMNNLKESKDFVNNNLFDLCASIQNIIVKILFEKVNMAVELTHLNRIALSGGVSANSFIRYFFYNAIKINKWELFILPSEYTIDNAAMIAIVGQFKYELGCFDNYDIVPESKYGLFF